VKQLLEEWVVAESIYTTTIDDEFYLAIEITTGEEKDQVVRDIGNKLRVIGQILEELPPRIMLPKSVSSAMLGVMSPLVMVTPLPITSISGSVQSFPPSVITQESAAIMLDRAASPTQ